MYHGTSKQMLCCSGCTSIMCFNLINSKLHLYITFSIYSKDCLSNGRCGLARLTCPVSSILFLAVLHLAMLLDGCRCRWTIHFCLYTLFYYTGYINILQYVYSHMLYKHIAIFAYLPRAELLCIISVNRV